MKLPKLQVPLIESWKRSWWIKVKTSIPACTYYFGPFDDEQEAKLSQWGYIEDLAREGAQDISVEIQRIRPNQYQLTIDDSE